jgi:hypothetical protein
MSPDQAVQTFILAKDGNEWLGDIEAYLKQVAPI